MFGAYSLQVRLIRFSYEGLSVLLERTITLEFEDWFSWISPSGTPTTNCEYFQRILKPQ